MVHFSKIFGLAGTALVFAGMAFGQNATCGGGAAAQTPLIRTEGTTELVGEFYLTCTGGGAPGTVQILDTVSLPITSKALNNGVSEVTAVVSTGAAPIAGSGGTIVSTVAGTVSGSSINFASVPIPAGMSYISIVNVRVNASTLTTLQGVTESAFVIGLTGANSGTGGSASVAFGYQGLSAQNVAGGSSALYPGKPSAANPFLVCQGYTGAAGLLGVIDVGENFPQAFKGQGGSNATLGSEFTNNTETGFTGIPSGNGSNVANTGTMLQVVFSGIPGQVSSLFLPITIASDQSQAKTPVAGTGTLTLVTSPSNLTLATASSSSSAPSGTAALTIASAGATAYYLFTPGTGSAGIQESFSLASYVAQTASVTGAVTGTITAVVSFAPIGSTQIPNFVIGASSTTSTLSSFTSCTTSLLFPFVTNQLGFDTGIAIANTSTDPFGGNGATPQAGTCTLYFYGAGAPTPNNVTTPSIPSGTVFTGVVSGLAAGFQGYFIAKCTFQYAHGFAFITDGVGANGGLSQGYLAGVIPDTNQLSRATANPIGVATKGEGETLGN